MSQLHPKLIRIGWKPVRAFDYSRMAWSSLTNDCPSWGLQPSLCPMLSQQPCSPSHPSRRKEEHLLRSSSILHTKEQALEENRQITLILQSWTNYWSKLSRKVSYKRTFGTPDQGQMLDVWESQTSESALRWQTRHIVPCHILELTLEVILEVILEHVLGIKIMTS